MVIHVSAMTECLKRPSASIVRFGVTGMLGVLLLGPSISLSQIGASKSASADPRVRRALQQTDLKYDVDKDGDYKLHFTTEDNRTQLVFIESKTEQWGNMEIRVVRAAAYIGKVKLTRTKLESLLRDTARRKSGAWELVEAGDTQMAQFTVKMSADCDPDGLKTVVWGVALAADAMEKELTNSDDL